MKHQVIIALGTNVEKAKILQAITTLQTLISDIKVSEIIPTLPLGSKFQHTQFYNALALGTTTKAADEMTMCLKDIERACGDTSSLRQSGHVVLDLDLMKYDNKKFHTSDWDREYIKELMRKTCI